MLTHGVSWCSLTTETYILISFFILSYISCPVIGIGEIIWAVNCGGDEHTDIHGINYEADSLDVGFASDYGKTLQIRGAPNPDSILYQTERYHLSTFSYDMPAWKDGEYVLVMKFSEVWFTSSNQKVFDVVLNGEHTIVSELDIFDQVGRGVAHDEVVKFSIKGGKLHVSRENSPIDSNHISLEFVKGELDNPKVNAIYLMKGSLEDVPAQFHSDFDEPQYDENEDDVPQATVKHKKQSPSSGPRAKDPYTEDDISTMLLPVFIAIGAFIPLLFCLCKL